MSSAAGKCSLGSWNVLPKRSVFVCLGLWPPESLTMWQWWGLWWTNLNFGRSWRQKVLAQAFKLGWKIKVDHADSIWLSPYKNLGHQKSGWASPSAILCANCHTWMPDSKASWFYPTCLFLCILLPVINVAKSIRAFPEFCKSF